MKMKTIYRALVPTMGLFASANICLAGFAWWRIRHPVEYKVQYIEPPRIELPAYTNSMPSVRKGVLPDPVVRPETVAPTSYQPSSWRMRYHYCVVSGRKTAFLNGVKVQEGDLHAFGVIRDIFPERIYFEGGAFIENELERRFDNASSSTAADSVP